MGNAVAIATQVTIRQNALSIRRWPQPRAVTRGFASWPVMLRYASCFLLFARPPIVRQHAEVLHSEVVGVPDHVDPHQHRERVCEAHQLKHPVRLRLGGCDTKAACGPDGDTADEYRHRQKDILGLTLHHDAPEPAMQPGQQLCGTSLHKSTPQ